MSVAKTVRQALLFYILFLIASFFSIRIQAGYEVCETLKADERTSHIPIILLTAKAGQTAKMEGLKYGAVRIQH